MRKKKIDVRNAFYLEKYKKEVKQIEKLEKELEEKTDKEMRDLFDSLKATIQSGEKTEGEVRVEVFAIVREVARRTIGLFAYPVQMIGAISLHEGMVSQMATGEGKTLLAVFPSVLSSMSGKGVHVVFPNGYLAKRDLELMKDVYNYLGISSGFVITEMDRPIRKEAYLSEITYVENSCLVFDYLFDNLAKSVDEIVQRELNVAYIDEVDAVLLDAARSPFVVSSKAGGIHPLVFYCKNYVDTVKREEVNISMENYSVSLNENGLSRVEKSFGIVNLYDSENQALLHYLTNALKAKFVLRNEVDYICSDGQILLIQSETGRISPTTRYQNGIHQAIEAKEHVDILEENENISSITYQNYFSLYKSISGMTGTAKTNEVEFRQVYGLEVVEIPRNKELKRVDHPDIAYSTKEKKIEGIIRMINERQKTGQPILVGCGSIQSSVEISDKLKSAGIAHQLLNATNASEEAEIISKAGRLGQVTIATNMAGRGTDIYVPDESLAVGGLLVIGTERSTSRRVDDQLRGRTGRQGNIGESVFHVSVDDELMEIYALDSFRFAIEMLGTAIGDEAGVIQNDYVSGYIARTQLIVEGADFQARENNLQYSRINHQWWMKWRSFREKVLKDDSYIQKELQCPKEDIAIARVRLLGEMDNAWRRFLIDIDQCEFSSSFSGYASKNPVQEYYFQTASLFEKLETNMKQLMNDVR